DQPRSGVTKDNNARLPVGLYSLVIAVPHPLEQSPRPLRIAAPRACLRLPPDRRAIGAAPCSNRVDEALMVAVQIGQSLIVALLRNKRRNLLQPLAGKGLGVLL